MEGRSSGIGEALDALMATVEARRGADPACSYTASLLAAGPERCAKKLGEEAVEAALAGALGRPQELEAEAADLLYRPAFSSCPDCRVRAASAWATSGHPTPFAAISTARW